MNKHMLVAALGIVALFSVAAATPIGVVEKPSVDMNQLIIDLAVDKAVSEWLEKPYSEIDGLDPYQTNGPYLHYSKGNICGARKGSRSVDDSGVVMSLRRGKAYYHPVMMAQCGLYSLSRYYSGTDPDLENAALYGRKLIEIQSATGSFPYPFAHKAGSTGDVLPAGWTSGMAQGQAISLFARLARQTHDPIYVNAGRAAFKHLTSWEQDGGNMVTLGQLNPKWSGHIYFEEYPTNPHSYTLNGFIFSLLGIYDWSNLPGLDEAERMAARRFFDQGVESLKIVLPLHDFKRMTTYDLSHVTIPARAPFFNGAYHGVHIQLLAAIHSITKDPFFKETENKWRSYVTD